MSDDRVETTGSRLGASDENQAGSKMDTEALPPVA